MDIEAIRSCRDNLLKEAFRLSKIINANSSYEVSFDEMMLLYECDIINSHVVDTTYLTQLLAKDSRPIHGKTMAGMMKALGYTPIASKRIKVNKSNHYVWFNPTTTTEHQARCVVRDYYKKKAPS